MAPGWFRSVSLSTYDVGGITPFTNEEAEALECWDLAQKSISGVKRKGYSWGMRNSDKPSQRAWKSSNTQD